MKTIPLTKGLVATVDDEDFERVSEHKWSTYKADKSTYAKTAIRMDGRWHCISLHRFLMNAKKGQKLDHWDGNGLNNQKSNLRFYVRGQNQMNMKCHNQHGFKGLNFRRDVFTTPWTAQINISGKNTNLGYFTSKIDAAIAYNIAAQKHFGEFAKLNPVPFTY